MNAEHSFWIAAKYLLSLSRQDWFSIATFTAAFAAAIIGIKQTRALKNAERAWILVVGIGNPPEQDFGKPDYFLGIVYKMKVGGRTPAKIVKQGFRFHSVLTKPGSREPDLPTKPDYRRSTNPEIPEGGRMILPDTHFEVRHNLEYIYLKPRELEELRESKRIMCAYGFIEYLDAFGRKGETKFCYVYDFAFGGIIKSPEGVPLHPAGFYLGGPRQYQETS